jgi:hypothetical protein
MTLIPKAEKTETKALSLRLPVPLLERLDRYSELVGRERAEVVAALVTYALDHDDEFATLEGREPRRRRSRTAEAMGVGAE